MALAVPLSAALITACGTFTIGGATASPTPVPTPTAEPTRSATPPPTPWPTPSPTATPTYTNIPDPELRALIPGSVGGSAVTVPDEISLTPGDVGAVFGEHATRFRSLVIGFTEEPRLTVFAMRIEPPRLTTRQLRPHLPEAGQYLGISERDPDAWTLTEVAGHDVWVRGEDEATSPGTQIYAWAQDDLVFLLIGTDEAHNVAMITALAGGEAAEAG